MNLRRREFVDYLQDILDAIEKAERFTEGLDFKSLLLTTRQSSQLSEH